MTLEPAGLPNTIGRLTACLALVRPVGMSGREAEDWLSAAASTLEHLPLDLLDAACAEARRTCTHHSQIVPAIVAASRPTIEARQRTERLRLATPQLKPLLPRPPAPPMTQADVDALPDHFVRLGLKAGFLARDDDGCVRLAPDGGEVES